MNISKKFYRGLMLACLLVPTLAQAEKILDRVDIVQTQTEADIHIEFLTQVRYIRHFPNNKASSRVQLYLEFPQLAALPTEREFLTSSPTDIVTSFTVNYPDQKSNSIGIRFKKPVNFRVTPDSSGRGIIVHVPLDKSVAPLAVPVVIEQKLPATTVAESKPLAELAAKPEGMSDNDYAGKLVAESRVAMGLGDYPKAIQQLNTALSQPANGYSQEAQELIGISREQSGELDKAKLEYETYLKLYPQGDGAARVRKHISIIDAQTKAAAATAPKQKKAIREIHETTVYGSWSQYYYDAHNHSYEPDPANNSHSHDQSSLISSIDLTARSRQNQYDSKIVFRNTQTMNFLPKGADRDKTTAAYVEVENKEADYLVRLGRQNGNSGGVLGRFDGGWVRYGLSPKLRVNLVGGSLNEYKVDYKRHFYGVNLDIGPINEKWSGNAYFINQTVGDITDRRAVGAELRYFDNGRSIYSLIDYDTMFSKLNTIMVQGNWQTEGGTNYNMLFDHRKAPILTMVNSLPAYFGAPTNSTTLAQALQTGLVTKDNIRQDALALTLDSDLMLFGATRQLTPRWQIGGDVQVSRTSGTQAAGQAAFDAAIKRANDAGIILDTTSLNILTASKASGNTWIYHAQVVGSDTIFKNDTTLLSVNYNDAPTSQSQSILFSNSMAPSEKWRLDNSIRLMRVEIQPVGQPSIFSYVISPTMRASYRLREKATLEAEIGLEVVNTNANSGHTRSFRDFSFVGYRLDI